MTNSTQNQIQSPQKESVLWKFLTGDIAVLLGALLGLGIAWRDPNPTLAGMAITSGVGGIVGFLISLFLRQFSTITRIVFLVVLLLVAPFLVGAVVYGLF